MGQFSDLETKAGMMKKSFRAIALHAIVLASLNVGAVVFVQAQNQPNPARDKFEQDIKSAVTSGSITVDQLKDIEANLEVLKQAKAAQQPGAPVDLMTPYSAVSKIKATMANVKEPARTTLHQDFQALMASRQPPPSATPDPPGKKLGKDIFTAVIRGEPSPAQVQQLQERLNSLEALKTSSEGGLQKLRTLREAKSQIQQAMTAGGFSPEDSQTVINDLNNLGH
jgi:hypothetical protein